MMENKWKLRVMLRCSTAARQTMRVVCCRLQLVTYGPVTVGVRSSSSAVSL